MVILAHGMCQMYIHLMPFLKMQRHLTVTSVTGIRINGEYFYQMFSGASKFNQGLSGWDFSSAKDIQYFYDTINPALTMTNFSSIIERLTQTLPVVTGTARRIHFDKVYHLLGDAQSITNILSNKNWRIISQRASGIRLLFLDNDDNIIVEYVKGIGETLRAPAKPETLQVIHLNIT